MNYIIHFATRHFKSPGAMHLSIALILELELPYYGYDTISR